ncbi:MAG: fibronectin type III domain-containing protein, partial [Methanomassiliicoccus sp.]|nr:fibronectin type III domain-containing protein [Methanomassiliicoccus sp.]
LAWAAPSDGGAPIDHYVVYQNGLAVQQVTSASATVTGLVNGQSYSFTVSAHNVAGEGPQSTAAAATPQLPMNVPGVPVNLQSTPGAGQVTLTWSPPTSDGGAAIDHYIVFRDGADVGHPTSTSLTITGLTDGTSYNFTVAAHNAVGTGLQSSAVQATPSPTVTIPGAPTALTATPGNGHIALVWTAPSNNGGAGIDHYVVFLDGVDVLHASSTSANLTGLLNGQTYVIAVAAHNSAGTSPPSPTVTATPSTSVTLPGAPSALNAMIWKDQVFLTWAPPGNDGGAVIEYYIIYQDGVEVARSNEASIVIDGLVNGQEYMFSVAAHNHVGDGPRSVEMEAVPSGSAAVPGAPIGLVVVTGDGVVTLSWSKPADGDPTVDYYIVYQNGVDIAHTAGTSIVISGLINGRSYEYTVAAHGPGGKGQASTTAYATPQYGTGAMSVLLGVLITISLIGLLMVVMIRKKRDGPAVERTKPSIAADLKTAGAEQRTCPRCWKPVSGNHVCEHCGMDLRKP